MRDISNGDLMSIFVCVANKIINGKQWYVDDLKVSHMEEDVVQNILKTIEKRFDRDLTITMGKKHKYLGMDIAFTDEGTVEIRMDAYVHEAIDSVKIYSGQR